MTRADENVQELAGLRARTAKALRGGFAVQASAAKDLHQNWRERPHAQLNLNHGRDLAIALYWLVTIIMIAILFDELAARAVRKFSPQSQGFFAFVTDFGKSGYLFLLTGLTAIVATAFAAAAPRNGMRAGLRLLAGRAVFVFVVLLGSGIITLLLKRIGRGRPRWLDQGGPFQFEPLALASSWASMPSGHTITAFALAVALGYFLPRWQIPLLLWAALIGLSRVVVGAHYPSDIVAGACIGTASAILLRRLFAVRGIVFHATNGIAAPRGKAMIGPALGRLMQGKVDR